MPPWRDILSFSDYAAIRHSIPHVVDLNRDGARLVLFGGQHSSDPTNPIFAQIEEAFVKLAPTFALHEGTPPAVEPDREIAIRRHGEAGLVRHLAARAGVPTASMDVPLPAEARMLRREFGTRDALVYLVVRQLASFNRKTARMDYNAYFRDFFDLIGPPLGIDALDWPLIEAEYLRVLGHPLSPHEVTAKETDPMYDDLPTQRISRRSNRLRDEHMLGCLVDAFRQHERVFATVGVTHAVMLEPALRAAIEHPE